MVGGWWLAYSGLRHRPDSPRFTVDNGPNAGGALVNQQGLLGADVPAGETTVTFTYRPTTFLIGLLGTGLTLALMIFLFRRWKPGPQPV